MKPYILTVITVAILACGCSPIKHTRGNLVSVERQENITIGQSTKADVIAALGTPTTVAPFNDNIWYYVGEKTERIAFFEDNVTERKILALRFDDSGTLDTIAERDETSGQEVDLVSKETPTAGLKINILQQFLGNIGRFNKPNAPPANSSDNGR